MDQHEILRPLKTIRDFLRYGASCFNAEHLFFGHGTDNAWDDALALVLFALHLSYEDGDKILDAKLTTLEKKKILNLFQERIVKRIPVPYIIQEAWFAGMPFYVDQRVLIPRSPIAELIEKQFSPWIDPEDIKHILELGTGSGCIAIACANYIPQAIVDAVDIDPDALAVAQMNVSCYALEHRVKLIKSDFLDNVPKQKYDIIVANPPYVDARAMAHLPKEFLHEPRLALAAGEDGLACVRRILQSADDFLSKEGILIVEVGDSAPALIAQYPHLSFLWLEFERGGHGVFLLTKETLTEIQ